MRLPICSFQVQQSSFNLRVRFHSTIIFGGGNTSKERAGKIRTDLGVQQRAGKTILSFTSRGSMLKLMQGGPASGFRPKRSSSSQLEEATIASLFVG